jgi:hypothetical protein
MSCRRFPLRAKPDAPPRGAALVRLRRVPVATAPSGECLFTELTATALFSLDLKDEPQPQLGCAIPLGRRGAPIWVGASVLAPHLFGTTGRIAQRHGRERGAAPGLGDISDAGWLGPAHLAKVDYTPKASKRRRVQGEDIPAALCIRGLGRSGGTPNPVRSYALRVNTMSVGGGTDLGVLLVRGGGSRANGSAEDPFAKPVAKPAEPPRCARTAMSSRWSSADWSEPFGLP